MASASKVSLFLAALKTRLEGVTAGADFHNTLTVLRVPGFEERYLDPSVANALCFLVPGSMAVRLQTFGTMTADLRVDVLLATRYEDGDDPFHPPAVDRWERQDRLWQDVQKRLDGQPKLGGTCIDAQITAVETSAEETFHATWAVTFLSLLARLEWTEAAP